MLKFRVSRFVYFGLLGLQILLFRNNSFAQDSLSDSIRYNLPEIVVTSSRILVPSPNIVREATTAEIVALNAHNVAEVLSNSTGLSVQKGTSGDAHVTVRGFRHRDVLILFDGIPISSGFEGTIDLSEVSIENVTKIKMIKGAPSVIYGTNAMGGVIDILPKSGQTYNKANTTIEFGENNARLFRVNYGKTNHVLDYFVSANLEESDGYSVSGDYQPRLNEDGGLRENSDYSRKNIFVHLNPKFETFGASSIFLNYSDNQRGFAPEAGTDDPDFERLTESKRLTLGVSNKFSFFPGSLKLYYNRYQSEETAYTDSTYSVIDEVNVGKDNVYGAKIYTRLATSSNNLLILNLSYERNQYENSSDPESLLDVGVNTYSVAIEDELSIKERVSVAVGGLFSRFEQTQIDKNLTALNAQIVIGFQVSREFSLHASAARRTRFPKLRELYREKYGNPDLKEQKANNYELGLKFVNSKNIESDLTVFYNKLDGLIDRADRRSPYDNLDDVTFRGVEFLAKGWLTNKFFAKLGYTYLIADEKLPDGTIRQLRRIPKKSVNTELRFKLPFNISISFNGIYVADLFDLDENQIHTKVGNYFLLNTKASILLLNRIDAYLALNNINDESYVNRLGFPREGRAVRFGLNLTL